MSKGRWKKTLLVFLIICVFVVTACLPQIAAVIQDKIMHQVSLQNQMQTIQLTFEEEDVTLQESFLRNINLFRNESLYCIHDSETAMTIDEVKIALETELALYCGYI